MKVVMLSFIVYIFILPSQNTKKKFLIIKTEDAKGMNGTNQEGIDDNDYAWEGRPGWGDGLRDLLDPPKLDPGFGILGSINKCGNVAENYNTNCGNHCPSTTRFHIQYFQSWQMCQFSCKLDFKCGHWVWHRLHTAWKGSCVWIRKGTNRWNGQNGWYRNYDTNTITGSCNL